MTSRMVAIAATCAALLCILLFLMGVEIGKQWTLSRTVSAVLPAPAVSGGTPADSSATAPKVPTANP